MYLAGEYIWNLYITIRCRISMSPDPEGFWCEYCDNNESCPIHNMYINDD